MQYKRLYHKVLRDGGATLTSRLVQIKKQTGFFVSLKNQGTVIELEDFFSKGLSLAINKLLIQYKLIHGEQFIGSEQFIGIWLDKPNEKVYIDISIWIKGRDEAIHRGLLEGQIAIWDIEKGQEIFLK